MPFLEESPAHNCLTKSAGKGHYSVDTEDSHCQSPVRSGPSTSPVSTKLNLQSILEAINKKEDECTEDKTLEGGAEEVHHRFFSEPTNCYKSLFLYW